MNLKYSLTENLLTERLDDFTAQVHPISSLDKEEVINRILKKGTSLTRTDILAVMNAYEETVVDAAADGIPVNTPLFNVSFSVSGVFDGPTDTFDPNRHKLNINLTKGVLMREAEKKVKLEKTNATAPMPNIQEVKDAVSGATNNKLTANGVIEVRGYNLKIDGDDEACGLWFVNENGAETRASIIIENKPSRILAMIPALEQAKYQVKVVTQYTGSGTIVKSPKIFTFAKNLTLEIPANN